jgi:hypothetical protein
MSYNGVIIHEDKAAKEARRLWSELQVVCLKCEPTSQDACKSCKIPLMERAYHTTVYVVD